MSVITAKDKDFIRALAVNGNYIVVLRENVVSVFNCANSIHMQDLKLPDNSLAKAIVSI